LREAGDEVVTPVAPPVAELGTVIDLRSWPEVAMASGRIGRATPKLGSTLSLLKTPQ